MAVLTLAPWAEQQQIDFARAKEPRQVHPLSLLEAFLC